MALNLSTLTNPATSGTVLAEALTTADLLDPVPILKNLSRGSNRGGDAKQTTALNQPKALPLIDGDGYLYLSGVSGNSATIPHDSSLNLTNQLEVVARIKYRSYSGADAQCIVAKWAHGDFNFRFHTSGYLQVFFKDSASVTQNTTSEYTVYNNNVSDGDTIWVKMTIDASSTSTDIDFYTSKDNVKNEEDVTWIALGNTRTVTTNGGIASGTNPVSFGAFDNSGAINDDLVTGAVLKANYKSAIGGNPVLDVDFTATNVRHGDTKFQASVGGPVTINQSGFDPSTIIKKPVLRFPAGNSFMEGVLGQNLSSGHLFMAFSVLGSGGSSFVRLFSTNPTGGDDSINSMVIRRNSSGDELRVRYDSAGTIIHDGMYDSENGDMLLDVKMTNGAQTSFINNADEENKTLSGVVGVDDFVLAARKAGDFNAAIDLEYLALFSADSVPDEATATKIRDYINKRNNVFSLVDNSYYFFDPQKATFTGNFTGSNTLDGYITGSDLGDTDVRSNLTLEQSTLNDQPSTDGYTITFNDAAEHLEFENSASQNLTGWQICGTSLGTFVYLVQGAVSELNLLGNFGHANTRQTGDLYGIILLPESATGADIESARKLLIDRGSSDALSTTVLYTYWYQRADIVHFKNVDMSSAVNVQNAWDGCSNMVEFEVTDISNGNNFTSAWQNCSSLQSFPAGAKLGTAANNVNFQSAFQDSGLTSFPADIDLSQGTNFFNTWRGTDLTSFETPITSAIRLPQAFHLCGQLTDFSSAVLENWNPDSLVSGVFNNTWRFCTSLTANSVEAILTSIDASNQHGTDDGTSTGNPLGDSGIDIDYNVATGSLTAATNAAIDSLSGKGWEVFINGVLVIPNILDLAPAAAYSLRSFDANADPNVVNVRRSSDGATSDFKASEVSDGTLVAFVGAGNDGHVTTFYDQGGTNHATQTVAASQPLLVNSGALVTANSKPLIYFDGNDDSFLIPSGLISNLDTMFVSAVLTNSDGNNDYGVVLGEPNNRIYVPYITSNNLNIGYHDSAVKLQDGAYSNGLQLITLSVNSSTASGFKNGQAFSTVATGTASSNAPTVTTNANRIGTFGSQVAGALDFSEVVIFNTDQSANRTGIENNIMDTYSIS